MERKEKRRIDKERRLKKYERIRILIVIMITIMLGLYYLMIFSK